MNKEIIEAVSELIMQDEDFHELSNKQDVYCPFEALSVARQEIRHSNFLADIVSQSGAHGFGDTYLRKLIETLLGEAGENELRLEIHLADLSDAIVLREWKRIDLLIRVPHSTSERELILVLEIKIEASESEGQLATYEQIVGETWPKARIFHFFLTPDQTPASRENWTDISFSAVLDAFEEVLRKSGGHPHARVLVESYIAMMRRRYVENPELTEIAQKIWSRHRAALEFLLEHQPNPVSELHEAVASDATLEIINRRLKEQGHELTMVLDSKSSRYIRFAVKDWDDIDGMCSSEKWVQSNRIFLLELDINPNIFHARWVVGRGPMDVRQAFVDAIDDADVKVQRRDKISPDFTRICSKALRSKKEMEKIMSNGVDQNTVEKARADFAVYVLTYLVPFHNTLIKAGMLKS